MRFKKANIIIALATSLLVAFTAVASRETSTPMAAGNPLITATYAVRVTTEDGKTIRSYERKSDSYVIGFLDLLFAQMYNQSPTINDTSNTGRVVTQNNASGAQVFMITDVGTSYGIVFGTGTNAVALTDYALQTLIANGSGAGQLSYQNQSYVSPMTSGSTRYFTVTRSAKNNTASTITVNELAVYGRMYVASTPYAVCLIRDVIGGGQAVLATQTITITYTISITV